MKKFYCKKESPPEEGVQTPPNDIQEENANNEDRTDDIEKRQDRPPLPTDFLDSSETPHENLTRQRTPVSPSASDTLLQECKQFFPEGKCTSGTANVLKESLRNEYRTGDSESHRVELKILSEFLDSSATSSGSRTRQRLPAKSLSETAPFIQGEEQSPSTDIREQLRGILGTEDLVSRMVNPLTSPEFLDSPGTSSRSRIRQSLTERLSATLPHIFTHGRKRTLGTDMQEDSTRDKCRIEGIEFRRAEPLLPSEYHESSVTSNRIGESSGRGARPLSDTSLNAPLFQEMKPIPGTHGPDECLRSNYRTETHREEPPALYETISDGRRSHPRPPSGYSQHGVTNPLRRDASLCGGNLSRRRPRPVDRFDVFGKMVAMKLRDLRRDQRRWAEKLIHDVLFEAEGGNLSDMYTFIRLLAVPQPTPPGSPRLYPTNHYGLYRPTRSHSNASFHSASAFTPVPRSNLNREHSINEPDLTTIGKSEK